MKHIHHLSTTGLVAATAVAVIIGETIGWYVTRLLDIRFPAFTVGMVCIGLVAATVSVLYDGRE
jgi:VIT1/CCC1 family predicted Fe2+/Mn2+ transporter